MKIIGETKDGYILSATKTEAANVVGVYSEYSDNARFRIGDELVVSRAYRRIYELSNNKDSLKTVCKQLHAMAELLEPVTDVVVRLESKVDNSP
jgi:hypothetical protein